MTVRTEHDLLGDREIPAEVYWGIHTLRAIENFKISTQKISDVPQFVRSMVMVKKATAQANGELGAVKPEIAAAIEKACDEVLLKGRCLDQFPSDVYQGGAGTSVNMNTNEVIANLALEVLGYEKGRYDIVNPMDHVNASQSTNDAYPTGFRLAVYYSIGELLDKLTENLIEATSDCGAYVMVHGALKRTAVKLSKICNDLRLLSSGPRAGLKEINLPELQAGSSIMPAKVNPVIPEVVNQVCFKVIGNDTTITFAAEAGQLQLNVMEPVIAQCMFETISLLGNAAINLSEKCVKGITVNREICERYVFNSIGLVTYLNPYIGHHNGDLVGKICAQTGKGVREVVLERGLLSEEEINRILSPENLMNPHL